MRNINRIIALISIIIFLFSCTSKVTKSWEETMKVHDEVMLKMQENGELESKLNALIIRGKADSSTVLFTKVDTLQFALDQLSKADEEMMDWMAAIRAPLPDDNVDSTLAYHEEQQKEIIIVGNHMDEAATNAEKIIKSLEK